MTVGAEEGLLDDSELDGPNIDPFGMPHDKSIS